MARKREVAARSYRQKVVNISSLEVNREKFIDHCINEKNLREDTITCYTNHIKMLEKYLTVCGHRGTVEDVTREDVEELIRYLRNERKWAQTSINACITHLKVFFNYLIGKDIIAINPLAKIKKGRVDEKPIIPFSPEQVKLILKQPDKSKYVGFRNYIIMLLFADTGVRISEALNIKVKDVDQNYIILTHTKNRKPRYLKLSDNTVKELKRFLDTYLDDNKDDYLFLNQDGTQLQKRTVQDFVKKYGEQAGIKGVRLSPHTFRHFFAMSCIKNNMSTSELRQRLGHETLYTVEKYLHWTKEDIVNNDSYSPLQEMSI